MKRIALLLLVSCISCTKVSISTVPVNPTKVIPTEIQEEYLKAVLNRVYNYAQTPGIDNNYQEFEYWWSEHGNSTIEEIMLILETK